MDDPFDRENLAQCGNCGMQVMTLAGWPGPVAACVTCDVWTQYREDGWRHMIFPAHHPLRRPAPSDIVNAASLRAVLPSRVSMVEHA